MKTLFTTAVLFIIIGASAQSLQQNEIGRNSHPTNIIERSIFEQQFSADREIRIVLRDLERVPIIERTPLIE